MENYQITELREFFDELATKPFLLTHMGVRAEHEAREFLHSHQEEEYIYEPFLFGLINQSDYYPSDPNKWIAMARNCNFNHPSILQGSFQVPDGGPVNDSYIYPKLLRWLVKNAPEGVSLQLTAQDKAFLQLGF
ncbi:hypothetical protein [Pseudovibrio brasiliensis]|uniref:Uncharacterized protein n=1 Tax=Pseudovibrio brasiliensis TaxID=1898042 RepID=A0ABX8AS82_9HYPH|nr:hypothetical protein [Pseudovibrio brasiliensis]QUS56710.1 hypothetical protein KGB56_04565 [Pseudovibrio brasiliensis]